MSESEWAWFVGVDWGMSHHAMAVSNEAGEVVGEWTVAHTSAEFTQFADALDALIGGAWRQVAVGIEVPRGAVVEFFLERGAAVFALNPKQLDRFRDRFSVAGAKDDTLDARVLSSSVRTDRARFRPLAPEDPRVVELRELSRADAALAVDLVALTNQLRDLVHRLAPHWLTLSAAADEPWFWALVELAATPQLGRNLRRAKIDRLLQAFHLRRLTPEHVLAVLATPGLALAPGTIAAVTGHIALVLPRVRLLADQRRHCARALEALLKQLATTTPGGPTGPGGGSSPGTPSDVDIVRSVPGAGPTVTATLFAEASALLGLRDHRALRLVTGAAPVRRQSGKQQRGLVSMRYACSTPLRNACFYWAFNSIRLDAGAKAYYHALRSRGHSQARALRSVADRWLRILIGMLKTRTLYNPARFAPAPLAP